MTERAPTEDEFENMSILKEKLRIVWDNSLPSRYMPKALGNGPGWRVFDRKVGKHLSNKEVLAISNEALNTDTFTS